MRTPEQERQFLLERSSAVGGSDVQHLLSLAPYGCRRRLWYDKKGVAADFPFTGNRHTRRGQAVEPHAIEEFCIGETYRGEGQPWLVQAQRRHAGAHIDHLIWRPRPTEGVYNPADYPEGRGVLEVKVPSVRNFYTLMAKGPPEAAQLQLQWGMEMAHTLWGVLLVFNADLWKYKFWTYQKDPGMVEDLLSIADRFWTSLESDRPVWERLDPSSRQCQDCPWRKTCQGITRVSPVNQEDLDEPTEPAEEDEGFFDLVAAFNAAATVASDAAKAKDAAKDALLGRLGADKPRRVRCKAGSVNYYEVVVPAKVVKQPEKRYFSLRVVPAKDVSFPDIEGDNYGEIETD
jgi:hypothetical protein